MRQFSYAFSIVALLGAGSTASNADPCNSQASREAAGKLFSVKFESQNAAVGAPLRVNWVDQRGTKGASPQYLIITAPDTVRFGKGTFFALRPDAPAPANAGFGKSLARAVIPLNSVGAPNGELEIIPFRAGELTVTWSVVAPQECPSNSLTEPQRNTISVRGGPVELVAKEDFPLRSPLEIRRSNSGTYDLLIFKDRFQVVDVSSGELILQAEGRNPVFSSTARFLLHETLEEETVAITDLVSGVRIFRGTTAAVAFALEDSFATVAPIGAGMTFLRTLQDTANVDETNKKPDDQTASTDSQQAGIQTKAIEESTTSIPLGKSLTGHRFIASDGYFFAQRAFRLSLDTGTVAYQERDETSPKQEDHEETAVEVRNLATGKVVDPGSELAKSEARKILKTPPNREIEAWFSGQKASLIFMRPQQIEGASLAATSRPVSASNGNTKRLTVENFAGRQRAMTVGGKPAAGTPGSFAARMNDFVGIAGYETPAPVRTSSDKKTASEIEGELSRVYDPKIATFGSTSAISYGSTPFPDPTGTNANGDGAVRIDLSKPGYVIWRWALGGTRYWFEQTIQAGRRAREFYYNLLVWNGKDAKSIDLLESAKLYQEKLARPGTPLDTLELGDFRTELDSAIREPAAVTTIGGRFVAFVPKPSSWLYVFDVESWKPHCLIDQAIDAGLTSWISLSRDFNSVLQFNTDGTFSIYACATGLRILSGAYLDDELVAMHSSGFFEGSYEAEAFLKLRIPGIPGKHFLRQYASKLRRHGLVADALAGKGMDTPDLKPPPILTVVAEKQAGPASAVRLSVEGPVPLEELQFFGDGVLFKRIKLSGQQTSQKLSLSELGAYRTVTAIAVDSEGVTSTSAQVKSNNSSSYKQGTLFAVGTGIDDYQDKRLPKLTYAASDARRVMEALKSAQGYAKVSSSLIPGREANVENIISAVGRIAQSATAADTILFFFSGHGLEGPGGTLFLGLPGTDTANLSKTALRWDDVAAALASSKARVVVLLDACHSGLSDRMQTTNDQAASRLTGRGGTPMIVLSASKGRQFSEESSIAGGGQFSLAFARIVGKERAAFDLNKNGVIEIDELYQGLKQTVAKSTNGRQTPWLSRNELIGDFPLF